MKLVATERYKRVRVDYLMQYNTLYMWKMPELHHHGFDFETLVEAKRAARREIDQFARKLG